MIDIHSHILPGIDDGAATEQDSIDMARSAYAEGITTIVASPHHMNGKYENRKAAIQQYVEVLNNLLTANQIPVNIIAGQEVRIYGELLEDMEKDEILTVNNSKYLLLEFPFDTVPLYAEQMIYDLQLKGIIPIIVHPERNRELRSNHQRMYDMVMKGALTQVTASSLLGVFGKEAETFSHQLIEHNLTHFIASDAHNVTTRGFEIGTAYDIIMKEYGMETYYMLEENSHLVIDNLNVNRYEPMMIRKKKKGLFNWLKK